MERGGGVLCKRGTRERVDCAFGIKGNGACMVYLRGHVNFLLQLQFYSI